MKLPISILLLASLGHAVPSESDGEALKVQASEAKTSEVKNSEAKPKEQDFTNKRDIYEVNFGEKTEALNKHDVGNIPKIDNSKEIQEIVDKSAQQIFGMRLPQIGKISDVLSGQEPSFEAAVAKHLYSPVSVYHARFVSPAPFEVPIPAASQSAYPKSFQHYKATENDKKANELQLKNLKLSETPLLFEKQPNLSFQAFKPGFSFQSAIFSPEVFQPQQQPRKPILPLFPTYNHFSPFLNQGQSVPSQFLQKNGMYQILPIPTGFSNDNLEETLGKDYLNPDNNEQLNVKPADIPKAQNLLPVPQQAYHAHPNGAISFASFAQNLPMDAQFVPHNTEPLPQPEPFQPPQPSVHQPEPKSLITQLQAQEQKLTPFSHLKLHYPPMFYKLINELQNYQSDHQSATQYMKFKQELKNSPRLLNPLQQHLLYPNNQELATPQVVQLQQESVLDALPYAPETYMQQTRPSPVVTDQKPVQFSFQGQSTPPPVTDNQPEKQTTSKLQYSPLPPLKLNYSKFVQPLIPLRASQTFASTALLPLPKSTPTEEPVQDQTVSSTTVQPLDKEASEQWSPVENHPQKSQSQTQTSEAQTSQSTAVETLQTHALPLASLPHSSQTQTSLPESSQLQTSPSQTSIAQPPLRLISHTQTSQKQPQSSQQIELAYQSQETVLPLSVPSSTYQPLLADKTYLEQVQGSVPQPAYQSTPRPQTIPNTPRHSVVIQRQELRELVYEPSIDERIPTNLRQYQTQNPLEQDDGQIQSQDHHQLYEQLEPQQIQQELEELNPQPSRTELRQADFPTKVYVIRRIEPQQYQFQQLTYLPHQQLQADFLQNQRIEQSQQEAEQQRRQELVESINEIQTSTSSPSQEKGKEADPSDGNKSGTTEKPDDQSENLPDSFPDMDPYLSSAIAPLQAILPRMYAQPLAVQPDYASGPGVPSYRDVQYFGKYAESLLGKVHH